MISRKCILLCWSAALCGSLLLAAPPDEAACQVALKKQIKNPRIVLAGAVRDTTDFFGRQRFIGKVRNTEKERIDYIKIAFTMRDREGKVIGSISRYIKGTRHQFYDFQVSTSSLNPGQTGTFDIITDLPADSVYSYTCKITGTHFIFK